MSSKRQKKHGYPLPAIIRPDGQLHFCVTIPDDPAYYMAMYAQLSQLGKWWNWKRDTDTKTQATESAMMWRETFTIEENCGGFLMTPEEFYDANKRSIYDAWNDIAKQIVSGRTTNIAVGDDGTVTDPTTGGGDAGLPEDDPATQIDETLAAKYGGVFALGTKIEEVLDKIDSLYGVDVTPDNTEQDAQATMSLLYPTDETAMNTAVSAYYSYRTVPNGQLVFNGGTDFFQHLYCNGSDLNSVSRFLINVRAFSVAKTTQANRILAALAPEFWSSNLARGQQSPSSDYQDAPCTLFLTQEHLLVPLNSNRQFFALKASHRVLLRFAGHVIDEDGDIQDAFWYRTAAGVLTRFSPAFAMGAGVGQPSDAEVAYNDAHIYEYTIELPNVNGTMTISINENAGIGTPVYDANKFSIKIIDFGLPYGS